MLAISDDQRRTRLAVRHALVEPVASPLDVARSLVALHSSDPSTVYLTVWARSPHTTQQDVAREMYAERSLLRVYGMRRTLWVIERDTLPLIEHSSTQSIAPGQRRRMAKMLVDGGVTNDGEAWLDGVQRATLALIADKGPILARDLSKQIPELREKLTFHNKAGELIGTVGVSTRLLVQLALESEIIRAEPVGSWVSSQYRWSELESWLGGPIPDIDGDVASARLLALWLARFGPATETDIKWWTGWTLKKVRKAMQDAGVIEVQLDNGTGYVNPDDVAEVPTAGRWIALLPSLDPTTMGWKDRDWYLGEWGTRLFDRNGNAGPTVWVDGRVVGGWTHRSDGNVAYELFEDVGREANDALADRAAELERWIGHVRVTARFRSPHDKELSS